MPSQGPSAFNSTADGGGGNSSWVNPNNALANDGVFATCALLASQATNFLRVKNPASLAIPAGSQILGIEIHIYRKQALSNSFGFGITDKTLNLLKANAGVGQNKADTVTGWTTTVTEIIYGGPTDLWNVAWADTDFGSSGQFGIQFQAQTPATGSGSGNTVDIDFVEAIVYYQAWCHGRFLTPVQRTPAIRFEQY